MRLEKSRQDLQNVNMDVEREQMRNQACLSLMLCKAPLNSTFLVVAAVPMFQQRSLKWKPNAKDDLSRPFRRASV